MLFPKSIHLTQVKAHMTNIWNLSVWGNLTSVKFSQVQSLSHILLFATPWTAACQASLSITNSQSLLKLMSIESMMPSNHLILCHPLSSYLQSFPASGSFQMSQLFTSRWPKYWNFSFNISPSNEYSGLISFRMDWLALLAVQGTLECLLQHHSSKASILNTLRRPRGRVWDGRGRGVQDG